MPAMAPRTLFGRIVLVIAMVSIAFQAFAIMVVTQFALVPLGRQATDDFGALMVDAARTWPAADRSERPPLQQRLLRVHRLRVQEPAGEVADFMHVLPYWHLLEAALSARSGQRITLRQTEAADGQTWIWAAVAAQDGRSGCIVRMLADGSKREVVFDGGGRPLGFDFDAGGHLVVAAASAARARSGASSLSSSSWAPILPAAGIAATMPA